MATASVFFSYISHAIDSFVLLITRDASTALLASCLSNVPNVHIHSILNLDGNMDGREKQNLHYYLSVSFLAIDNDADCFFSCIGPVLVLRKSMLTFCLHSYCKHKMFYFLLSNRVK